MMTISEAALTILSPRYTLYDRFGIRGLLVTYPEPNHLQPVMLLINVFLSVHVVIIGIDHVRRQLIESTNHTRHVVVARHLVASDLIEDSSFSHQLGCLEVTLPLRKNYSGVRNVSEMMETW